MKKTHKVLIGIALGIVLFVGGLTTGKLIFEKPTREVWIGYESLEHERQINFPLIITDLDDLNIIDNLQGIFMYSQQIEDDGVDRGIPDLHIYVNSPRAYYTQTHARIWFDDEGAIIIFNDDDFRKIDRKDANYLREIADSDNL
ncbi:hypothetical protein [Sutcliffiella rhizosphaerae]|uniref:Uncharacterized protein n=1 Tax=Sutcliffiella rhizosphaerae TaxID=2880967 RepID=A0ABN8A811_9BACI|nr:hypothetical protein [Sutcliffiella rhizosphaerae]CAG9621286.1 hypothetical protein BACCIP111883_02058 [Sutcliffiella rhizosphaerae]